MASSPTLLGLPAELQIEIAKELDDQDLIAFHQICRELTASTIDVFAERFFRRRSHLYTIHSLGALRDISNAPVFARHIKCLELVVVDIEHEDYLSLRASRNASPAEDDAARRWYDAEKLEMRRHGHKYLAQIFANLKRLGSGRELKLTGNLWTGKLADEDADGWYSDWNISGLEKARPGVYGTMAFVSSTQPWAIEHDIRAGTINFACRDVFAALLQTGHHLTVLDLGYQSGTWLGEYMELKLTYFQLMSLSATWSSLQTLKIGLEAPLERRPFSQLLRSATHLTDLSLEASDAHNLECIHRDIQQHQLSSISISGTRCNFLSLVRFLASQSRSLNHLQLSRVTLETFPATHWPHWGGLFKIASRRLELRSVELNKLHLAMMADDAVTYVTGTLLPNGRTDRFLARGSKRWMRSQLAALGKCKTYRWGRYLPNPHDWQSEDESDGGHDDEAEDEADRVPSNQDEVVGRGLIKESVGDEDEAHETEIEEGIDRTVSNKAKAKYDEVKDEYSNEEIGIELIEGWKMWNKYEQGREDLPDGTNEWHEHLLAQGRLARALSM